MINILKLCFIYGYIMEDVNNIMHITAYISILMLSEHVYALSNTSVDASSTLISKEGSIHSALASKAGKSAKASTSEGQDSKEEDSSLAGKPKEKANPKTDEDIPVQSKSSKSAASGLLSDHAKEPTHIIRLSESNKQVIRDAENKKSLQIIKDDDHSTLVEKKSALSNLASEAIENRNLGEDRKELHEASTNLI